MMTDQKLSLREAAELLGVHYMTVYRYVRLGMLPARKAGAAWEVLASDVTALKSGGTAGPAPRGRTDWKSRLKARLLAGDEAGAWGVVEAALTSGLDPSRIHLDLLAPAMEEIGDAWARGDLDVADEHLASSIATRIVGRLGPRFSRRGRSRGVVVLATPAGERHSLPAAIVADHLRGAGFDVVDLGCDVPPSSLAHAVADVPRLVAVALSVTRPGLHEEVQASIAAVRETAGDGVAVFAGGRGIDGEAQARRLGADGFASDAAGAVTLVEARLA